MDQRHLVLSQQANQQANQQAPKSLTNQLGLFGKGRENK